MPDKVTLEQVEELVAQLPPKDQLKLLAHIGERLGALGLLETDEERQRREYAKRVKEFLKMSKDMAAESVGEVDSAKDIRQIRAERMSRL